MVTVVQMTTCPIWMRLPLWNFLYGTSFIELSLCDFPDCYESEINTSTSNSTKGY